jgi:hypothetical protein
MKLLNKIIENNISTIRSGQNKFEEKMTDMLNQWLATCSPCFFYMQPVT